MGMEAGYPTETEIDSFLAARGLEIPDEYNSNYYAQFKQFFYGVLNALDWAAALGVYCPSTTTFNVRGGKYRWRDTVKTYAAGDAVDPADSDTTYVWLKDDNTIGYGSDGSGWPTTEHIKLAELDVDADGVITAVRDLRGQTFMQHLANYLTAAGTSVEALPIYWDKTGVANDEIRIPICGKNAAGTKTEFGRFIIKLTNVGNGTEAADILFSRMLAGALTSIGSVVGTDATQTLTNKTLTSPFLNGELSGTAITTDTSFVNDSPTKVPTQRSVRRSVSRSIVTRNGAVVTFRGDVVMR